MAEKIDNETQSFHEDNVRLVHLGRVGRPPPRPKRKIEAAIEVTKDNTRMMLCLVLDHGSRDEIVGAARRLIGDGISPANIDEALFSQYLHSLGIPDPDLIIGTGAEIRLSNFCYGRRPIANFASPQCHGLTLAKRRLMRLFSTTGSASGALATYNLSS